MSYARAIRLVLFLTLVWPALGQAQNLVYHSPNDDGVNPGTSLDLPVGPSESLFLYLDSGSDASTAGTTPCSDGDGRELCGYEVTVDAVGGALFADFFPAPNVVFDITPTQLKANGLFALTPALGPVRIGELRVVSSAPGSEVMIMGGAVVLSALQVETIPQTVVANSAVPEPGFATSLAVLLAGLAALTRKRSGRG